MVKKTLLACAILFVIGIVLFVIPSGESKPEAQCVPDGSPSSGFIDDETGCAITIESAQELLEWEGRGRIETNPIQAAGLMLAMLMVLITPIATFIAWVVQRSRKPKPTTGQDHEFTPRRT